MPKATIEQALHAVVAERLYQDVKLGVTSHALSEWFTLIHTYTQRGMETLRSPGGEEQALEVVRAISAIGIAAMEEHGAPCRPHEHIVALAGFADATEGGHA